MKLLMSMKFYGSKFMELHRKSSGKVITGTNRKSKDAQIPSFAKVLLGSQIFNKIFSIIYNNYSSVRDQSRTPHSLGSSENVTFIKSWGEIRTRDGKLGSPNATSELCRLHIKQKFTKFNANWWHHQQLLVLWAIT